MNDILIKSQDVIFTVHIIEKNQKYGLNDALTHDQEEPMVEFYDGKNKVDGQFVSRYYLSTLLEMPKNHGLILDTASPRWTIDEKAVQEVVDFLKDYQSNLDKDSQVMNNKGLKLG